MELQAGAQVIDGLAEAIADLKERLRCTNAGDTTSELHDRLIEIVDIMERLNAKVDQAVSLSR